MARETVTSSTVQTSSTTNRDLKFYKTRNIIYTILGIIEILLAFRFVFLLLGANQASGFVSFIYGLTGVFVAPFVGIFGMPTYGTATIDTATLIAAAVYAIIAWIIVRIVAASANRPTDRV